VWDKKGFSQAQGLYGRTLGIIGLGQIGIEVMRRAQAMGMNIVCWARSLTPAIASEHGIEQCADIYEVARRSDAVTVHLALAKETRGLLNAAFFKELKAGAYFINTARSEVVDETAMLAAVAEKGIRVGTDVPSNEPSGSEKSYNGPLKDAAGVVYTTHHIGASTDQAQQAVADETVRIVKVFMETGEVPNCVNLRKQSQAKHLVTVRHRDRVGVLAECLSKIRDAGINVQEMENIFFESAETACARIRIDSPAPVELLEVLRKCEHVLNVTAH
jgi:D-3-phosphoglycerate dehydrogenase